MNNRDIGFTHRPIAGVSVGVYKTDPGNLYIAASFTNDGTSRNGNYRPDRTDAFSRARARLIITGRLQDAITSGVKSDKGFVFLFLTDKTVPEFMREFRKVFKPELDESDDVLHNRFSYDGSFFERARMRTDDMWNVITKLANDVLNPVLK